MSSQPGRENAEPVAGKIGRPRCPEAHKAILDAAESMLLEIGYPNLTIEGVAARAGVGKMTIYRRWKSKAALVVDAFQCRTAPDLHFPKDAPSTRESFRTQMYKVVEAMNGPRGKLLAMLIAYGQKDPELERAFLELWFNVRRTEGRPIMREGMARGEIRDDLDVDLIIDTLYGPLYFRLLVPYAPLTNAYVDSVVSVVFDGASVK